jgi:hypothetical protein
MTYLSCTLLKELIMFTYIGKVHCVSGWKFGVVAGEREYMFELEAAAHAFVARMNQAANA